jgi:small multidrug resistance pump
VPYLILAFAVLAETIGTAALQASQQFTKLVPSIIVVLAYGTAFYLLAIALKFFPVGIAYAIWSGLGIVFISIIGFAAFGQKLDLAAVAGITMILGGILVIHVFSTSGPH